MYTLASMTHHHKSLYRCLNKEVPSTTTNIKDLLPSYKEYLSHLEKQQSNPSSSKIKLIIMIRHGEGVHNYVKWHVYGPEKWLSGENKNPKYIDPSLTEKGVKQAKQLLSINLGLSEYGTFFLFCCVWKGAVKTMRSSKIAKRNLVPWQTCDGQYSSFLEMYGRSQVPPLEKLLPP